MEFERLEVNFKRIDFYYLIICDQLDDQDRTCLFDSLTVYITNTMKVFEC